MPRLTWSLLLSLTFCWTAYFCLTRAFRGRPRGKAEAVKGLLAAIPAVAVIGLQIALILFPGEW